MVYYFCRIRENATREPSARKTPQCGVFSEAGRSLWEPNSRLQARERGAPREIRTLAHARSGFGSQATLWPDSLPNPVRISLGAQKAKQTPQRGVCFVGAPREIRTLDLPVRSRALYPLSYGRILFRTDPERLSIVAINGRNVKRKNGIFGRKNQRIRRGGPQSG